MAPALTVKQYDTGPPLQATLTDSNGAINLTTATAVKIVLKGVSTGTTIGPSTCTIANAAAGQISYTWGATDLNTADTYNVEFSIHWSNGTIQKVPNAAANNPQIEVDADLAGAGE
jgi:hypothetical protein